ncbi:hypothetical protein Pst134EA_030330 [Puccinia striiformis f. sp. tritici]|uniref:hypothetical protein n=1 Tax=Puccinia striiformis f. sp. tritici TaxID=168172 RepID=UPI000A126EB8|nr:hypothetical protein Pst134EA_030330 [Puccinia striiformis f. sp. tritici]KAH9446410.1 hypothetical protein Pst134EA_030330 [Puccinia striiformis f. sp. tritici]
MERQINNYLDLSPKINGFSSPIGLEFERAPTPGLGGSATPKPFSINYEPEPELLTTKEPELEPENKQTQRKRRQDEEEEPGDSSLSDPPSEPPAPLIEPKPKRTKLKKTTTNKKLKQAPADLTHSVSSQANQPNLEEPKPLPTTNSLPQPPPANPTETSKLSKLSFKRKKTPAKKGKAKPTSKTHTKITVSEVQEDSDLVEGNQDPIVSANSNLESPSHINNDQQQQNTEPDPPNNDPKLLPHHQETTLLTDQEPSSSSKPINKSNPIVTKTSTKKPVKPGFKKINKSNTITTTTTSSSTANTPKASAAPQVLHNLSNRKKAGEYDLNDPNCWGALFGGGDKKPAVKPVKPGNLPPTASLYSGNTAVDRLEARKKQRLEEKKILLHQQMKCGFDLLRQNMDMMDFEIEYKNHVRAMVEKPLSEEYLSQPAPTTTPSHGEESIRSTMGGKNDLSVVMNGTNSPSPANVLRRADGYNRYINPPPPTSSSIVPNSLPSTTLNLPPPPLNHQPPGPIYSSTAFNPSFPLKVLPRPGMFGSSFFIWQAPHLP